MKPAIGINDLLRINFDEYPFDGQWEASFGRPEKNFRMLILGPEKNGKTDFMLKICKYLSQWGKVYINSHEEGRSKTLQTAFIRNNMQEVAGKVLLLHKEDIETLTLRLKKKASPRFIVIDSLDYMEVSDKQYKALVDTFPRKCFIFICWVNNKTNNPLLPSAEMIAKRVDIKVLVKKGVAYPESRFGGNEPFTFWRRAPEAPKEGQQLSLLS